MIFSRIIILIILTALLSRLFFEGIVAMLRASESSICMTENYRKLRIPSIGGIAYIPLFLASSLILSPILTVYDEKGILFMFLISSIGFIGLLDDLAGDKSTKGIRNHVKKTMEGMLTTGFLKAAVGFALSFIASMKISANLFDFLINTFVIALFTNTINLLDLRPGRAVKSFLFISVVLIITNLIRIFEIVPLLIVHVISWIYIIYDLKEKCMLGDTGSNILGISLGYYSALLMGSGSKAALLALLVSINLLSEKVSITEIIRKNRLLSYMDRIGRG